MGPLADHDRERFDLKFDAFLKPNKSFNEDHGKLRLAVRFFECDQAYREIRSRHEFSQEELENTWYSAEDYRYIKAVNTATVQMMSCSSYLDPEIYCPRGLECRTAEGWQQRLDNKRKTRAAVLREQEIQKSEGVYDADMFEEVSRETSDVAKVQALERARQDEADGRKQDDDTESYKMEDISIDLTYFSFFSV